MVISNVTYVRRYTPSVFGQNFQSSIKGTLFRAESDYLPSPLMYSSSNRCRLALSPIILLSILIRCSYALSRESASIMPPGTIPHICRYLKWSVLESM